MRDGLKDTPSFTSWLNTVLPKNSRVGVDPWLFASSKWKDSFSALEKVNQQLVAIEENLIDEIWTDQPPIPCNPVKILGMEFTGQSWEEKVKLCRKEMEKERASLLIFTALDEIAYLLNLRGSDIIFNPVFFAYVIVSNKDA